MQSPEKWADFPSAHRQPGLTLESESQPPSCEAKYNPKAEFALSERPSPTRSPRALSQAELLPLALLAGP